MASTSLTFDILARDKASRTFKNVGNSASKSSSHIEKFGAVLKKSAVGIGLVTAAAGVFIAKAGVGYVDTLNKIQAITGANNKQMNAAAKFLEGNAGLYAKMGQTTGDAASGVVELAKSGLSLHASLKAVYGTMVLAKAGELDVADASAVVSNALNVFHLKANKAGDVANYLANAANISSADVSDLTESLKYVSPVAAKSGVSIQQVNAILAELANAGIKGTQAGTSLRTFLLNLQAPSGAAKTALHDLNVEIFDAQGNMKPLPEIIGQLGGKLDGLSQKTRQADLKAIFGKTGISGATQILSEGTKGLAKYTKGVEKAGAAQKLAEAKSKGLAGSFNIVIAGAKSGAQSIYRQFSPIADRVIRPLANRFATFAGNLGPNLAKGTAKVKGVLDRLNITGVGKNLAKQAQDWAKPVIAGFRDGLDKGDWSGLGKALGSGVLKAVSAMAGIAGKLADAFKNVDWVGLGIDVGKKAVPFLVGFAAGLLAFDPKALFEGIMKHWSDILIAVLTIALPEGRVASKIGELLAKIPFAGKLLSWGFLAMNKFSRGLIGKVLDVFKFFGRAALTGIRRVFPEVGSKFSEQLGLLPTRLGVAAINLAEKATKMMRGLGAAIAKGTFGVVAKIFELISRILRPWVDTQMWLVKKGADLLGGLLRGIGSMIGKVLAPLKSLGGRIVKAVGNLGSILYNAGAAVIEGLWNGISSKLSWLGGKLGGVGSFIKDHKGPIEKDRELLRPAGRAIMDGLMAGIADRQLPLQTALDKVSGLVQKAGDKLSNLKSTRAGFRGTFTADSIFGTDLSQTKPQDRVAALLSAQEASARQARQLNRDIKQLTTGKGPHLSKSLINQLRSEGASGAAALHALATGDPSAISKLNRLNRQTNASLQSAGVRAGNYVRGGSIADDIRRARKQDHVLELLERHLKNLAESEKKGETIVVKIGEEAIIRAIHRRNTRKGVKTANL